MMNKRKMFRVGMAGLVAFASLGLVSCDLDNENVQPAAPVAYVSIYNASPNSPELEINVDDRQLNSRPFEYADNTGYLQFYTGDRNLSFGPFGASNVAVDTTVTLLDNNVYSIFVVDNYEHADVLVLNDSSATPGTGKAMVRFINLSPDSQPVALKVKNASGNLTENIAFKGVSNFSEVTANGYNLQVVSAGNEGALDLPGVDFQAGLYYTVIVRGYRTPPAGNSNVISAEVISNN